MVNPARTHIFSRTRLTNSQNKRANRRRRSKFRPQLEMLERRNLLAAAIWDGGAGADVRWSTPANWADDQLPLAGDEVTINDARNIEVLYDLAAPLTIASLNTTESLKLTAGELIVSGSLVVAPGEQLTADSAKLQAIVGVATIDGVSLFVSNGGNVKLVSTVTVTNTTESYRDMVWEARGEGSELTIGNLTRIDNGQGYDQDIFLQAYDVGLLELRSVTNVEDHASGDARRRSIQVLASGANSRVDLPDLVTLSDSYGFSLGTGDGEYSQIITTDSGVAQLGSLTTVHGVYLPLDGDDPDLSTVTSLTNSRLELITGIAHAYPNLTSIDGTDLIVNGDRSLTLAGVTTALSSEIWNDKMEWHSTNGAFEIHPTNPWNCGRAIKLLTG